MKQNLFHVWEAKISNDNNHLQKLHLGQIFTTLNQNCIAYFIALFTCVIQTFKG